VTEKLIGENFHTWQRSMTRALSAKNKLGFVNGSISQPIDPLDPLFDIWTRCNDSGSVLAYQLHVSRRFMLV
jgi:hypothetical protein